MPILHALMIALSLAALLGAAFVVLSRNIFRAAIALGFVLTVIGGLYAGLGADFLAVGQVLVYTGGVVVLMLFVLMFLLRPQMPRMRQMNAQALPAVTVSILIAAALIQLGRSSLPNAPQSLNAAPTTAALGSLFLGDMLVPFEVISLVLLAALIGAVYFSIEEDA